MSFDFDGTLANSAGWFFEAFNRLAPEFGFKRLDPACPKVRALDAREGLRHLGIPLWKLPRVVTRLRTLAAREAEQISLFPGTEELLSELRSREIEIAIVSSNAEETIRRVLGSKNALRVNYYACGASLFGKAAKLRTLLRRSRRTASEIIHIGDETRDAEAAHQVQVDFGAVRWGFADPETLAKMSPRLIFSEVGEIMPKLASVRQ